MSVPTGRDSCWVRVCPIAVECQCPLGIGDVRGDIRRAQQHPLRHLQPIRAGADDRNITIGSAQTDLLVGARSEQTLTRYACDLQHPVWLQRRTSAALCHLNEWLETPTSYPREGLGRRRRERGVLRRLSDVHRPEPLLRLFALAVLAPAPPVGDLARECFP
jgi:hypothetical protein